jgi:hypothetical protein
MDHSRTRSLIGAPHPSTRDFHAVCDDRGAMLPLLARVDAAEWGPVMGWARWAAQRPSLPYAGAVCPAAALAS